MEYAFIRDDLAGIAVGIFFSALIAYLALVTRKRERTQWEMPEPESSGLLVIAYLSASYLVSYVVSRFDPLSHPALAGGVTLVVLGAAHVTIKRLVKAGAQRIERVSLEVVKPYEAEVARANSAFEREREEHVRLRVTAGIQAVFSHNSDPALFDALQADVEASVGVRAWASRTESLFGNGSGTIGQNLMRASLSGKPVKILTAYTPTVPVPSTAEVLITAAELPEVWLVECNGAIYAGAPRNERQYMAPSVTRLLPAPPNSRESGLFEVFHSALERLERSARDEMSPGKILVGRGPQLYRSRILTLEASAERIDRVAKRIFIIFKDPDTVEEIARQRYGDGHQYRTEYIMEHKERREVVLRALESGVQIREIYSAAELRRYVASGQHGASATLQSRNIRATIANWKDAIRRYPNYHVSISSEHLPLHYEIIDSSKVILHEAIGYHEKERINSIFLESPAAASKFQDEFDSLWDRTPRATRDRGNILSWISSELESLLVEPSVPQSEPQ